MKSPEYLKQSQEEVIKGSIVHVLNFIALRMMTTAFAMAFEGELSNMKEFMSPEDRADIYEGHLIGYVDTEIALLETIEDIGVKTVTASMQRIFDCVNTYLLINNLDVMEIMEDPIYMDLASTIYVEDPINLEANYATHVELETLNFFYYNLAIWRCIQMLLTNQTESEENEMDIFMDQYYDFESEELTSEDKNIALLYDLMRFLEQGKIGKET